MLHMMAIVARSIIKYEADSVIFTILKHIFGIHLPNILPCQLQYCACICMLGCGMPALHLLQPWSPLRMETVPTQLGASSGVLNTLTITSSTCHLSILCALAIMYSIG